MSETWKEKILAAHDECLKRSDELGTVTVAQARANLQTITLQAIIDLEERVRELEKKTFTLEQDAAFAEAGR